MPSIEGDEIDVALAAGFKQQNICIIDKNAAIVATLKRKYPYVRTYGVPAEKAAQRIADDIGGVDFANLDLCGPIGRPLWDTLAAWREHRAVKESGLVAVTVLRGRESGAFGESLEVVTTLVGDTAARVPESARDTLRIARIGYALSGMPQGALAKPVKLSEWCAATHTPLLCRNGIYRSTAGSQTMLWTLWKMHSRACLCDECCAGFSSQFLRVGAPLVVALRLKREMLTNFGWRPNDFDISNRCVSTRLRPFLFNRAPVRNVVRVT